VLAAEEEPAPTGCRTAGLMRVAASGGIPEPLGELRRGGAMHRWPTVPPSGRVVVFTTTNTAGLGLEGSRLVAQSLDTGTRKGLPVEAIYAAFAPDGRYVLLFQRGRVMRALFFSTKRRWTDRRPASLHGLGRFLYGERPPGPV
jgi:hypothetical protein